MFSIFRFRNSLAFLLLWQKALLYLGHQPGDSAIVMVGSTLQSLQTNNSPQSQLTTFWAAQNILT